MGRECGVVPHGGHVFFRMCCRGQRTWATRMLCRKRRWRSGWLSLLITGRSSKSWPRFGESGIRCSVLFLGGRYWTWRWLHPQLPICIYLLSPCSDARSSMKLSPICPRKSAPGTWMFLCCCTYSQLSFTTVALRMPSFTPGYSPHVCLCVSPPFSTLCSTQEGKNEGIYFLPGKPGSKLDHTAIQPNRIIAAYNSRPVGSRKTCLSGE